MGNIINYVEKINKLLEKKIKSVEVVVVDYKNEKYTIVFHKGQDVAKKAVKVANMLGDGNCVKKIKLCK